MALRMLKEAMYPTCSLHNEDFQKLEDRHDFEYRGQSESVQPFLADLLYNM